VPRWILGVLHAGGGVVPRSGSGSGRRKPRNLLAWLSRIDVLVIDDWAMAPLAEPERHDLWEICEDRYRVRSLILTSQLAVTRWHEQIGDPTVADGILDRLVHNAHRIEMRGDSMRKNRGKPNT
jgi:DNA replication protein DnaC